MRCASRSPLLAGFLALSLSACAPVMLGRTPTPAAVGQLETTYMGGFPLPLTYLPVTAPLEKPPLGIIGPLFALRPNYAPTPSLNDTILAYRVAPGTEINAVVSVGPLIGLRVGGKTLLLGTEVRFAADYGVYYFYANGGVDAGLLASLKTENAEFYAGPRGFGNLSFVDSTNFTLAGALTLGGALPVGVPRGEQRLLLELTLLAHGYNGFIPSDAVQPVGFSLMPGIGFAF